MSSNITINIDGASFKKFVSVIGLALLLAVLVYIFFYSFCYAVSEYYFIRAAQASPADASQALAEAQKAYALFPTGNYLRLESSIAMNQLATAISAQQAAQKNGKSSSADSTKLQNLLEQSITLANTAAKTYPHDINNWLNVAQIYQDILPLVKDQNTVLENIVYALQQASALEPTNVTIINNIGRAYISLANLSQTSAADKTADTNFAIQSFKKSLTLKSDLPDTFYYLGSTYYNEKRADLAKQNLEQAIALDPANTAYYYALGNVFQSQGNNTSALAAFNKALSLDPSNSAIKQAISDLNNSASPSATSHSSSGK